MLPAYTSHLGFKTTVTFAEEKMHLFKSKQRGKNSCLFWSLWPYNTYVRVAGQGVPKGEGELMKLWVSHLSSDISEKLKYSQYKPQDDGETLNLSQESRTMKGTWHQARA